MMMGTYASSLLNVSIFSLKQGDISSAESEDETKSCVEGLRREEKARNSCLREQESTMSRQVRHYCQAALQASCTQLHGYIR